MKFLSKREERENFFDDNSRMIVTYTFKKGKYNKKELNEIEDRDYLEWILTEVRDLEEERLAFEKRILELIKKEEEEALNRDIDNEIEAISKLKKEIEALKAQNSVLADKKAELKALKEEKEKLMNEKKEELNKTEEALKNIGINFDELEKAIDKILSLANRESFTRASTKKEIYEEIEKFDKAAEALEQIGLASKAINRDRLKFRVK